jgi:hypothetical protein
MKLTIDCASNQRRAALGCVVAVATNSSRCAKVRELAAADGVIKYLKYYFNY